MEPLPPLFDSHLHLTAEAFAGEVAAVVERAKAAGVMGMVSVASDIDDGRAATELASAYPHVWSTIGLHPHEASRLTPDMLTTAERLAANPRVVAIGETGLDYFYENSDRPSQRRSFTAHMELAERVGKPVVVHSRAADADTAAIIREFAGRVSGVLHCFTGGDPLLAAGLDAGWYVSFSGIVTFRRFDGAARVRAVPDDRLLIETDSPYLAPVPRRGKRNEPANLPFTCRVVAELRGAAPSEVARRTRDNARTVYGLTGD